MFRSSRSYLKNLLASALSSLRPLIPLLAFTLLIAGPGGCGGGASGTGIDVSGKLLEVGSNQPIANASVRLDQLGLVVTTDAEGNFTFGNVPAAGSYDVTAMFEGFVVTATASNIPQAQSRVFLLLEFNRADESMKVTVQPKDDEGDDSPDVDRDHPEASPTPTTTPNPLNPFLPDPAPVPTVIPTLVPEPTVAPTSNPAPVPSETPTPVPTVSPVAPTPTPTANPTAPPATPTPAPTAPIPAPSVQAPTVNFHVLTTNTTSFRFTGTKAEGTVIRSGGQLVYSTLAGTIWDANMALVEGNNTITFVAVSAGGSASAPVQTTIKRDTAPPQILSLSIVPVGPTAFTFQVMMDEPAGIHLTTSAAGAEYQPDENLFLPPPGTSIETAQVRSLDSSAQPYVYSGGYSSKYFANNRVKLSFTLRDYSGYGQETQKTIYFDNRLLQPHPLAPTQLVYSDLQGRQIEARAAERPEQVSTTTRIATGEPIGLIVDPTDRKIIWIDRSTQKIKQSALSGSSFIQVHSVDSSATALGFDQGERKFYWAESANGPRILRSDFTTNLVETVANLATMAVSVDDLVVDPIRRKVYWACALSGRIGSTSLEGGATTILFEDPAAAPTRLALDLRGRGKIYWTDKLNKSVRAIDLRNNSLESIANLPGSTPIGIAFEASENRLYWSSLADADGTYALYRMVLRPGEIAQRYQLSAGASPEFIALTKATYRVSGRIMEGNTPGVGYSVRMTFSSDDATAAVLTDSNGEYYFDNLPFGAEYHVWAVNPQNTVSYSAGEGVITADANHVFDTAAPR